MSLGKRKTNKMYKIMGEYRGKTEELEETANRRHAEELAREFRVTYGEDWRVWIEDSEEEE